MSVATKNPFALLEAEGTSRPASPTPTDSVQPPAAATRGAQKLRGGPASRGGRYYSRGGARKPAPNDGNAGQDVAEEPTGNEGQRRNENNRGRGRGGRGGGPSRGGRRTFDRHSATGKTDSDKKIHQSWGGDDGNTELKTEEQATADATAESNAWGADLSGTDWGTAPADSGAEPPTIDATEKLDGGRPRREREPEEEDNTLTFDQYLAQQKEKESAIPKLDGGRQVEAGEWKDVVPLEKGEGDSYFIGKTKAPPKARTKKEEKVYLEIEPRFEHPNRGRGRGRGFDRGGDRGRGGRGRGGRGHEGPANTFVDVADQNAFPSLT